MAQVEYRVSYESSQSTGKIIITKPDGKIEINTSDLNLINFTKNKNDIEFTKEQAEMRILDMMKDSQAGVRVSNYSDTVCQIMKYGDCPQYSIFKEKYTDELIEKLKNANIYTEHISIKQNNSIVSYKLYDIQSVFYDAGMSPSRFINDFTLQKTIASTVIDTATKVGDKIMPKSSFFPSNGKLIIDKSFMKLFAFDDCSIESIDEKKYKIKLNGAEITNKNNEEYFIGNPKKNKIIDEYFKKNKCSEKCKQLLVAKELGDVSQALLYYIYSKINENESCLLTTNDKPLFVLCMLLDLPCIFAGNTSDKDYLFKEYFKFNFDKQKEYYRTRYNELLLSNNQQIYSLLTTINRSDIQPPTLDRNISLYPSFYNNEFHNYQLIQNIVIDYIKNYENNFKVDLSDEEQIRIVREKYENIKKENTISSNFYRTKNNELKLIANRYDSLYYSYSYKLDILKRKAQLGTDKFKISEEEFNSINDNYESNIMSIIRKSLNEYKSSPQERHYIIHLVCKCLAILKRANLHKRESIITVLNIFSNFIRVIDDVCIFKPNTIVPDFNDVSDKINNIINELIYKDESFEFKKQIDNISNKINNLYNGLLTNSGILNINTNSNTINDEIYSMLESIDNITTIGKQIIQIKTKKIPNIQRNLYYNPEKIQTNKRIKLKTFENTIEELENDSPISEYIATNINSIELNLKRIKGIVIKLKTKGGAKRKESNKTNKTNKNNTKSLQIIRSIQNNYNNLLFFLKELSIYVEYNNTIKNIQNQVNDNLDEEKKVNDSLPVESRLLKLIELPSISDSIKLIDEIINNSVINNLRNNKDDILNYSTIMRHINEFRISINTVVGLDVSTIINLQEEFKEIEEPNNDEEDNNTDVMEGGLRLYDFTKIYEFNFYPIWYEGWSDEMDTYLVPNNKKDKHEWLRIDLHDKLKTDFFNYISSKPNTIKQYQYDILHYVYRNFYINNHFLLGNNLYNLIDSIINENIKPLLMEKTLVRPISNNLSLTRKNRGENTGEKNKPINKITRTNKLNMNNIISVMKKKLTFNKKVMPQQLEKRNTRKNRKLNSIHNKQQVAPAAGGKY